MELRAEVEQLSCHPVAGDGIGVPLDKLCTQPVQCRCGVRARIAVRDHTSYLRDDIGLELCAKWNEGSCTAYALVVLYPGFGQHAQQVMARHPPVLRPHLDQRLSSDAAVLPGEASITNERREGGDGVVLNRDRPTRRATHS